MPTLPCTMTRSPAGRFLRVLVLATGLVGVLLLTAGPVIGVDRTTILEPTGAQPVSGPFSVVVEVDASDGELIESVQAQLAGPTNRAWTLESDGPPDIEGVQRWSLAVDPLGDNPMRNGRHRLTARAVPTAGEPPPFDGFEVTLRVPAITPLLARPTPEDAQRIQLAWNPTDVPDFIQYRVQRRPDAVDGEWATIQRLDDQGTRSAVDTVPQPGSYRYRLVVVRSDGRDGRVSGYSATRGVRTDGDQPGTFDPAPEPTPTVEEADATEPADPAGSGGGAPLGRPGQVAQADPGPPQTSTAQTPPVQPQIPTRPRPVAPAAPAPPAVIPFNDGVFQPELPIGETQTELTLRETETSMRDGSVRPGGTVAVLTEEPIDREVVVTGAVGLLLVVVAGHVRRFISPTAR